MGLFDSIRSTLNPTLNTQQAIMTIVVAAIKADGSVSEEELMRLRAMCSLSPIFAANTSDQDRLVAQFADNFTDQMEDQAIRRAAAALTPELRQTAFAFACDMVLADGLLGQKEQQFIAELAQELGVSEAIGSAIVHVTLVRNRS